MSAPVSFRAALGAVLLAPSLLLPRSALAWPVDLVFPLEAGTDRFHKLSAVEWVEVEDPSVATAEVLPGSNELLVTGMRPGRTLLLLYAEGKFGVWRMAVTAKGARTAPEHRARAAGRRAEGLSRAPGERGAERSLVATVKDSACRKALLALFQTDAWLARELDLTFELPCAPGAALSPECRA